MACGYGFKMSDEVYQAIAEADSGFVESPAGCGKTEAIVRTVGRYCNGMQLVLTHTHAGVDALRKRFREHSVPITKYHIDTIAGWSWGWVRKYPLNARYQGSIDIAEWNDVYAAMTVLLDEDFVTRGILNSYDGIIVDEYQDCTRPMHALIARLNGLLPCRVLGDELQGIFDFKGEPLVSWADVRAEFRYNLGVLDTPYRWRKADNEELGRWLLNTRDNFRSNREPNYNGSPIGRQTVSFRKIGPHLLRLTSEKKGSICIVKSKVKKLNAGLETTLVKRGYRILEPNNLSDLRKLILALDDGTSVKRRNAVMNFLKRVHGGLPQGDIHFIEKIIMGEKQRPLRGDRRELCDKHGKGITPHLIFDLLEYCDRLAGVSCKLRESVSALRCILEEHLESDADLKSLYAGEIAQRKYHSRTHVYRSIGSTLLVKGLEFDHAVILRDSNWQRSWGGFYDLYVALTRGSKSATLLEIGD